jgi:segregation and condensation protein B
LNGIEESETVHLIEALLFLENRPVNVAYISKITGKPKEAIRKSIDQLTKKLRDMDSALIITKNERGDYHLTIAPSLYDQLGTYYDTRKKMRLSVQALETLAIIAYKQPITRIDIEKIRGVQVGHILRVLLEYKLIHITGKKDSPGRPVLYGTTENFLKSFGLLSIKDLPPISEFERA